MLCHCELAMLDPVKSFNLQSKLSVGRTRGMDQNFDIRNLTISRDQNLKKGIEKMLSRVLQIFWFILLIFMYLMCNIHIV